MKNIDNLFINYPNLTEVKFAIIEAFNILLECYKSGGKVLVCGNGGSASDAEHITGELMKSFKKKRSLPIELKDSLGQYLYNNLEGALSCISLVSQTSLITAFSNDKCSDLVFAQEVLGYGKPNDVLLAISTSGNSENVINAVVVAKALGLKVIGLTRKGEHKLLSLVDVCIGVPKEETYQIQELHLPIYHALCAELEEVLF